ncbi:carbonic anhydrase-like [Bacillus rossius redtenbacheri]|uniref:carbonic anhydrase-like n=1 Tax=Bacillus rossius redtenbacheri TaxID=93214 RepID=UPI002FDE1E8F
MAASALLLSGLATLVYAADWSYSGANGPDHWGATCRTGKRQSPVDLARSAAAEGHFHDLALSNYDQAVAVNVTNNGHTVRLDVEQPCSMLLAAGGLPGLFRLEQIHFHWPSEHTLDGNRWPLEIHLVHYDLKYSSIAEAVKYRWGVAVLAILCHEDELGGEALGPLLRAVGQVERQVGATTRLPQRQAPASFLPRDLARWYRYEGSLTTPGCDETVVWTVLRASLPVSRAQIAHFQRVLSKHGRLQANNRPLQPLNGRAVHLQDGPWNAAAAMPETRTAGLAALVALLAATL